MGLTHTELKGKEPQGLKKLTQRLESFQRLTLEKQSRVCKAERRVTLKEDMSWGMASVIMPRKEEAREKWKKSGIFQMECLCHLHEEDGKGTVKTGRSIGNGMPYGQAIRQDFEVKADR